MDGKHTAQVSSNAFACGVSQNCGNVLTERPTTLLHAPPGGHSTICLRHDEPAAAETPRRVCAGGASSVCLGTDVSGGLNHIQSPPFEFLTARSVGFVLANDAAQVSGVCHPELLVIRLHQSKRLRQLKRMEYRCEQWIAVSDVSRYISDFARLWC